MITCEKMLMGIKPVISASEARLRANYNKEQ